MKEPWDIVYYAGNPVMRKSVSGFILNVSGVPVSVKFRSRVGNTFEGYLRGGVHNLVIAKHENFR